MHSKTITILATLVTAALAIPAPQTTNDQTVNDSVNVDQANQQCGNDQALSCCSDEGGSDGGLIGGILDGLLGGSCNQIPISRASPPSLPHGLKHRCQLLCSGARG
jgi:hypothetical protein